MHRSRNLFLILHVGFQVCSSDTLGTAPWNNKVPKENADTSTSLILTPSGLMVTLMCSVLLVSFMLENVFQLSVCEAWSR